MVVILGFAWQFRFIGLAAFSQEAMLAYLQFNWLVPPGAPVMQNFDLPVTVLFVAPFFFIAAPLVWEPLWAALVPVSPPLLRLLGEDVAGAGPGAF